MPDQSVLPNESKNEQKLLTLLLSCLCIYTILRSAFLFIDVPELWGVNLLHYLPIWVGVVLSLVAIASIILSRNLKIHQGKETSKNNRSKVEKKGVKKTSSFTYLLVGTAVVLGIMFLVFRIAWPFLGDGTTYFGFMFNFQAYGEITTQRTATPVLYLLYGIYSVFLKLANNDLNVSFPFTVMSFISGTLFVTFSFLFAKTFSDNGWIRLLFISLLLTLGGSLLFFGYIETYPLQYACVLIYAYYSYQYLQQKANLVAVTLALVLCIAFHMQNILLLPSFVLLYSLRNSEGRRSEDRSKFFKVVIFAALPVMIGVYVFSQMNILGISPNDPSNPFIPMSASSYMQYSLFHWVHLLDILNEHLLLAAIPLIVIISCLVLCREKIHWRDPFVLYLLLNIFFVEAFLIGGNLGLGIARDWDICSSLGISIALLAVVIVKQSLTTSTNLKRFAIPISVVTLSTVLPWVIVNARITSSVDRYEDLLEVYTPIVNNSIARVSYENLRKYYLNNDVDGEMRTVRKMMELMPTHIDARIALIYSREHKDVLSPLAKQDVLLITDIINNCTDSVLREETFEKVRVGAPHSGENVTLGDFYGDLLTTLHSELSYISYEQAKQRTQQFIDKHPDLPYGYERLGYMQMIQEKNTTAAVPHFAKAIALDSMRARPYLYYAYALTKQRDFTTANTMYRRALTLDPKWILGITLYVAFLTDPSVTNVSRADLEWARSVAQKIAEAPAESAMEFHKEEYEDRVRKAQQFLLQLDNSIANLNAQDAPVLR